MSHEDEEEGRRLYGDGFNDTCMMTKKKPRKKLTPTQEIRLLRVLLVMLAVAVLWLLISPANGLYGLVKVRKEARSLEKRTEELARSNEELKGEIDRLRNDPQYLERIAREKYDMMKKNEQVFDFSRPDTQTGPEDR